MSDKCIDCLKKGYCGFSLIYQDDEGYEMCDSYIEGDESEFWED